MRRVATTRARRADLLVRPACPDRAGGGRWDGVVVDPVEQLKELADLLTRGLLTREEFESHKARIFGI
ncbi:MAG TPA: SHOCT domain-containing protein [Jiangellaceae bacterium]